MQLVHATFLPAMFVQASYGEVLTEPAFTDFHLLHSQHSWLRERRSALYNS